MDNASQKTPRAKKLYPYDFKTTFGVTALNFTDIIASAFMSSYFLLYLTDYAGLGLLGATIAPVILVIGRVVDALNDPLQGWIVDATKPKKMGKFRVFLLFSMILTTVAIAFLYSIPAGIKTNAALLFVWILVFYLLYDMGSSLHTVNPLIQSFRSDQVHRAKLMTYQRFLAVILGAVFSTFLMIVNAVNEGVNDFGKSFSLVTVIFSLTCFIISLLSLTMVKEGSQPSETSEEDDKIRFKDLLGIFKLNRAFNIHFIGQIFRGLVYALMTSTTVYYAKWAYTANLQTGEVDLDLLGAISALSSIASMLPMLIAAALSPLLTKKLRSSVRLMNLSCYITFAAGFLLLALHMTRILQASVFLFLLLMAVMSFGNGLAFVPAQTMWIECIDYNAYKTGKGMGGMINVLSKLLGKAHAALSTLLIGLILAGIGYNVDSVTGDYVGALDGMPTMLTWFIVASGLLPAVCSILSILIYRKYPIDEQTREQLQSTQSAPVQPD